MTPSPTPVFRSTPLLPIVEPSVTANLFFSPALFNNATPPTLNYKAYNLIKDWGIGQAGNGGAFRLTLRWEAFQLDGVTPFFGKHAFFFRDSLNVGVLTDPAGPAGAFGELTESQIFQTGQTGNIDVFGNLDVFQFLFDTSRPATRHATTFINKITNPKNQYNFPPYYLDIKNGDEFTFKVDQFTSQYSFWLNGYKVIDFDILPGPTQLSGIQFMKNPQAIVRITKIL
jgi:hypothetical protein